MTIAAPDLPVVSIVASPTKRSAMLELAVEAERRGFPAIACPSLGGALGLCASLAHVTDTIRFFTSIQPIYLGNPRETAVLAGHIHELSGGRFALGLGVSHESMLRRFGVAPGPSALTDVADYLDALRGSVAYSGELPPIYLAALRDKMLALALDRAEGVLWANASRRDLPRQLARVPAERLAGKLLATMVPTVITGDLAAARAIHRRTMLSYVVLPNYRNYWKSVGYVEEMEALEAVLAARQRERLPEVMSDAWLDDCTVSGSAHVVRETFAELRHAGVTPIAVMSSTSGGQAVAIRELFAAYERMT